jgi:hypothetical protein
MTMASTCPSRHLRSGRLRKRSQFACRQWSIADAPDEMGVPTVRRGAKWRPSSVQAATGYRRRPRSRLELPDGILPVSEGVLVSDRPSRALPPPTVGGAKAPPASGRCSAEIANREGEGDVHQHVGQLT